MIHWVKTMPAPEIDHSVYRPFIRNDWFRKNYMVFAYGLMAVLAVLCFVFRGERGIPVYLRLVSFAAVFLVH